MREVAPYAFDAFPDDKQRIETIKRSGRRRLAALMDEPLPDGTGACRLGTISVPAGK